MDLEEAYQQIVTALRNPEFLRRLVQILEKERRVKQAKEKRDDDDWNINDLAAFELIKLDAEIIDSQRALYSTFEDHVKTLPQPPVISADDLQEVALAQLSGMTDDTVATKLQQFIHHILLRVDEVEATEQQMDFGDWLSAGRDNGHLDKLSSLLDIPLDRISLANGFELDLRTNTETSLCVRAKGYVRGVSTRLAARRVAEQIRPSVESLIRSLKFTNAVWAPDQPPIEFDIDDLLS
jgi:hypothetical protein